MPGSADRNDPDVLAAISTNCCPVPPFNLSYHQEARLVFATSGRLQHPRIVPQHMRFIKFGAMTLFAALLSGPCSNVARPHDVETISVQSNSILLLVERIRVQAFDALSPKEFRSHVAEFSREWRAKTARCLASLSGGWPSPRKRSIMPTPASAASSIHVGGASCRANRRA